MWRIRRNVIRRHNLAALACKLVVQGLHDGPQKGISNPLRLFLRKVHIETTTVQKGVQGGHHVVTTPLGQFLAQVSALLNQLGAEVLEILIVQQSLTTLPFIRQKNGPNPVIADCFQLRIRQRSDAPDRQWHWLHLIHFLGRSLEFRLDAGSFCTKKALRLTWVCSAQATHDVGLIFGICLPSGSWDAEADVFSTALAALIQAFCYCFHGSVPLGSCVTDRVATDFS
ncbi:hypothetical protein ACO7_320015 [Thiomonas arsenitoxydans]|nr:hypothetical protein ACO7_320015 [Thiomonas arsenitoxydans]CQR32823.1 hypothetical protein ACO3_340016 [Thiomonas arsenitoxydans]CQR40460.1 hypothetical protein THICB6_80347 [Thiomonas arsenitoxydans]